MLQVSVVGIVIGVVAYAGSEDDHGSCESILISLRAVSSVYGFCRFLNHIGCFGGRFSVNMFICLLVDFSSDDRTGLIAGVTVAVSIACWCHCSCKY